MAPEKKKNILFFHPDLGIGGAERLIIDAAVGLQNRGHKVVIFTSHCDPKHCFDEARDGMSFTVVMFQSANLGQALLTSESAAIGLYPPLSSPDFPSFAPSCANSTSSSGHTLPPSSVFLNPMPLW